MNIYKAGYAPQSDQAQLSDPPTLVTHTGYLNACQYDASLGSVAENTQSNLSMEDCFHYFARDRSLASPDWKLVLPLGYASDNDWIMNDGVPDDDKAIIEDIVLYLRHRSRPVGDQ